MRTFIIVLGILLLSIGAGAIWDTGGFFLALGAATVLTVAFYMIMH